MRTHGTVDEESVASGASSSNMLSGSTETCLTPEHLRDAHAHLLQSYNSLGEHAAMIHRIHYKSHAKHRGAKWFQSVDGVRRCLARLLGSSGMSRHRYSLGVHVEGSLPNRPKKRRKFTSQKELIARSPHKHDSKQGQDEREIGRIAVVLRGVAAVRGSFWGLDSQGEIDPVTREGNPTNQPSIELLRNLARDLILMTLLTEELRHRTEIAFAMMESHLRTPPAPTFASLVVALATLMAATHKSAGALLWEEGHEGKASSSCCELYNLTLRAYPSVSSGREAVLQGTEDVFMVDRASRDNRSRWDALVNATQAEGFKNVSWLPGKLERPALFTTQALVSRVASVSSFARNGDDSKTSNAVVESGPTENQDDTTIDMYGVDEEDLGEAV